MDEKKVAVTGMESFVIDWGRVNQLREEVGPEAFVEIAAMFLAEADVAVGSLVSGAEAAEMAADLHAIKGSALNLGFAELADLCARGEAASNAGHPDTADIPAIRRAYSEAKASFVVRFPVGG